MTAQTTNAIFSKSTTREEVEQFFAWAGEYGRFIRFIWIVKGQKISVANELYNRFVNGETYQFKIEALELGFN